MPLCSHSHNVSVLKMLRDDEGFAIEYLSVALQEIDEEGGGDAFLLAVRRLAEARGGLRNVSKCIGLARADLNQSFAAGGDPKLSTLLKVLLALGIGMSKVVTHRIEDACQ